MKKLKYIWLLIMIAGVLTSCNDEEGMLEPSGEELFPPKEMNALDSVLAEIYAPYNTIVEYRYIKNFLPKDWYYITPPKVENILPMAEMLKQLWIGPLEAGSSRKFVEAHFPRMIILVGSPARRQDGTVVLGQAEGGTLIRFTEVDNLDLKNRSWIEQQMNTAFHEYAHILHQTFRMPDAFRNVTPDNYTKNGWRVLSQQDAIIRGMVSAYGTNSVADDFAELFAFFIMTDKTDYNYVFEDQPLTSMTVGEMNKGRAFIRTKLSIMKKFLLSAGLDMEKVRENLQAELKNVKK